MRNIICALCLILMPTLAHARDRVVDLELLLAIDISSSVDDNQFELQKQGVTQAFIDDDLVRAITSLPRGRIAVAVMLWSGSTDSRPVVVPWVEISNKASATEFSSAVARIERPRNARLNTTGMGAAVADGVRHIVNSGYEGDRRVIDVASDGWNNDGPSVSEARDMAVEQGITVNGLAILENDPDLLSYFEESVIGGFGAFALPARSYNDFVSAMRSKLFLEIAGIPATERTYAYNYTDHYVTP